MPTVASVMSELKKKGKEQARKIYARHGMDPERVYGVSVADMKVIAKTIRGEQALACELTKPELWTRCTWLAWWPTARD